MLIESFLDYLRYERNLSPGTVENYSEDLRNFEVYLKNTDDQLSLESADSDLVRNWMEDLMERGVMATTVNTRLSSLKSFYRFALMRGKIKHDPVHLVKGPKKEHRLPQFLKEQEVNRLVEEDEMWEDTYKDVRARTIINMLYQTGIRLSELITLDDVAVDFSASHIKVTGKRNKQRIVPFGEELDGQLKHYLKVRDESVVRTTNAFFVTEKGQRMSPPQVREEVKKNLSKVSTQQKRSPHVLRHTFATAMLNNGAGIESVKKLLGHEKLETTMIYTHTTFEQLKRVYKQSHPRE